MKGFFSFDEDDFDRGYRAGREQRRGLMFHLTITTDDLDRFIDTPEHLARAEGYVRSDALGGGELAVERGLFNLFVDQEGDRRRKRMLYRLFFSDAAGHPLTLSGFKVVEDDPGLDNVWSDTSTLFTKLLRGHVEAEDESRRGARRLRDPAHPPAGLRPPDDHLQDPPRRAGRRGRPLRRAVRRGALGGLRRTGAGGAVSEGLETTVVPFTAGDGLQLQPAPRQRRQRAEQGPGPARARGRGAGQHLPPADGAQPGPGPGRLRLRRLARELAGEHRHPAQPLDPRPGRASSITPKR